MQINSGFSPLDWGVFFGYFALLGWSSWYFGKKTISSTQEYFTASNTMPTFAVALSILATSQSAATFLGAPEFSYLHNFSFLGFYVAGFFAVLFINTYFVPRFYAIGAISVYELLEKRYNEKAKQYAAVMFLLGRILASGARLYIGALAISMILFLDTTLLHLSIAATLLVVGALSYSYFGGVRSVILSDTIQAFTYTFAALLVLYYLYTSLDMFPIIQTLQEADKLTLIDTSWDGKFNVFALATGWFLLNVAAFGLDQDMTQRVLSCKNKKEASRALLLSIILSIGVVFIFLAIGALLYLHYHSTQSPTQIFHQESITIFMYYILNEMPQGLKGIVTVGAIAAALSSTNSVLGAMASVAIEDIYKPYKLKKDPHTSEKKLLQISQYATAFFALVLLAMALLCYQWQHTSQLPLLSIALGVMSFAYSGLLGVFFAAVFTKRGSQRTVLFALLGGFLTVLALQPYIFGISINFAYQILLGTCVAFAIMMIEEQPQ